jgi:hypothetical protein
VQLGQKEPYGQKFSLEIEGPETLDQKMDKNPSFGGSVFENDWVNKSHL